MRFCFSFSNIILTVQIHKFDILFVFLLRFLGLVFCLTKSIGFGSTYNHLDVDTHTHTHTHSSLSSTTSSFSILIPLSLNQHLSNKLSKLCYCYTFFILITSKSQGITNNTNKKVSTSQVFRLIFDYTKYLSYNLIVTFDCRNQS